MTSKNGSESSLKKRVLLVDDEARVRASLKAVLEPVYEVIQAADAQEGPRPVPQGSAACRAARRHSPRDGRFVSSANATNGAEPHPRHHADRDKVRQNGGRRDEAGRRRTTSRSPSTSKNCVLSWIARSTLKSSSAKSNSCEHRSPSGMRSQPHRQRAVRCRRFTARSNRLPTVGPPC